MGDACVDDQRVVPTDGTWRSTALHRGDDDPPAERTTIDQRATAARETSRSPFSALRHRDFRRVWCAALVSQTGNWLMITGRAFLVYRITDSEAALGTVYFFSLIPVPLFSQLSGVVVDRFDRRRILITSQLLFTAVSLLMAVLAQTERATLANVSAISFVYGTIQALSVPVQQAVVPSLVPRSSLTQAVALQSMINSSSRMFGPALSGVLLPLVGLASLFYLNAVSFGFVVIAWLLTPIPSLPDPERGHPWQALRDGLDFARRTPSIAVPVAAAAVVGGIGLSYSPQVASYTSLFLAGGDEDTASRIYGLMQFSIGLGAVVGIMALPRVAHRNPGGALVVGVVGFSVSLVLLGAVTALPVVIVTCLLLGAFQFATGAHALSLVQHHAPERMRGRLVSLHQMAWIGVFPVIGVVTGWLATSVGLRPVFIGTGLVCLLGALPLVRARHDVAHAPAPDDSPLLSEPGGPHVHEQPVRPV